jgi:dihydroxyacetone kinase
VSPVGSVDVRVMRAIWRRPRRGARPATHGVLTTPPFERADHREARAGEEAATALLHAAEHLASGGRADESLRAAAEGIADLGGARRGDRTLLDALCPAADELASSGSLSSAAAAAAEGAEATATMTPRRGRSSYLGERAHGHRDAGAEAVVVVRAALAGS